MSNKQSEVLDLSTPEAVDKFLRKPQNRVFAAHPRLDNKRPNRIFDESKAIKPLPNITPFMRQRTS